MSKINEKFEVETVEGRVVRITEDASRSVLIGDLGKTIQFDNASGDLIYTVTTTVQSEDAVPVPVSVPIGSTLVLTKTGAGDVTVTPDTGVTFYGAFGDQGFRLNGTRGSSAYLEKLPEDNSWEYSGVIKDLPV